MRRWLVALTVGAALSSSATAHAATPLQISSVTALDARTLEIRFNQTLSRDLRNMVAANNTNTSYVHQFIRLSGGQPGSPDAALTGTAPLSTQASGTRNYPVETAAGDRLRIVLPASTTLTAGREYTLRLDTGDATTLAENLFSGEEPGSGMEGSSTPPVTFTGNGDPLGAIGQPEATVRDSRVIRLTFPQPVISGMPMGTYTNTTNFTLTGGAAPLAPVYIEPVPNSDRKQFDLYFAEDFDRATTYTLNIAARTLNLQTYGGTALPANTTWSIAGLSGDVPAYEPPAITSATVNAARNELRLRFNHRVKWVKAPTAVPFTGTQTPPSPPGTIFVRETSNLQTAGGHSELHAEDIRAIFDLDAEVADDTGDPEPFNIVDGDKTDAANRLREDAAHWVDRQTLVIHFQSGVRLARNQPGTIAIKPEMITDITGKTNAQPTAPTTFTAPDTNPSVTAPGYDPDAEDYLRVDEHAETVFRHFDYTYDSTGMFVPSANVRDRIVDQRIPAVTVENKYIKVLFTPAYGGRMQSIVYKPTGHDLLYTNPVGTPYGNGTTPGTSPFYNGWLMVYGGVFPTFSEAEHGKYWFVPWDYTVKQTDDAVELQMTKTDTFDLPGHPSRFRYGITGLRITVTYKILKDSPVPRMTVLIENPTDSAKEYEYWTCTTLAPGGSSDPWGTSLTAAAPETDIVSPNPVIQQYSGYTWMLQQEDRATPEQIAGLPPLPSGENYLQVKQLNRMINWSNNGIAYGQGLADNPQGDWWGVVNRESAEGVLRVGDNDITPGMKYWEWGFNGSFNTNPYTKGNSGRPYVELWGGVSKQFFVPDTLAAGASKTWTEAFLPTMDMPQTTNANVNGAASLEFADRKVTARVFSTHIGRPHTARIVDAVTGKVLASRTFVADPMKSVQLRGDAPAGTTARLVLTDADGNTLLTAEKSDGLGTIDPAVPAGKPTISGKATRGETLTGVDTTWSGSNATFTYEWLRDGEPIATGMTYTLTTEDVGHEIAFRVTATNDAGTVSVTSDPVVPNAETSVEGSVGGEVPATLALTLGAPVSFGTFVPGVERTYEASTTATVTSSAGDATLTVADPSSNAPGHLVNGAFALPQPLQGLGVVKTYAGPVANDLATITFRQPIGATDALRTGTYSKTLTFTLSTTTP